MKLLRYGPAGSEKPALLDSDGVIRDLSGVIDDIDGTTLSPALLQKLQALNPADLPAAADQNARIGSCVARPGKFICIGLNYSDHAAESGLPVPKEPIIFFKATSALSGPNDDVEIPRTSEKSDWEVELGVIIGKDAKYITKEQAKDHIAGYCVVNDLSERAFQIEREGQWVKGKSCDTFGPIGPWLVTPDEVDVNNLHMWLEVNGERVQDGNTNTMIFDVEHIVAYLSQFMSLQAGDVITTGTPPGVGLGFNPPRFLKVGDTMELGIEGLGTQKQVCVKA